MVQIIHVVSAGTPSSQSETKPQASVSKTTAAEGGVSSSGNGNGDAFDKHNKPRIRCSIILSTLHKKYPHLLSFSNPSSAASNQAIDLLDLYRCVHDEEMIRFLLEAWSKWKAMGPPWDEDNCHPKWNREIDGETPPLIPCHSAFRKHHDSSNSDNEGREEECPSSNVMGAIGYYCTDFITPIVSSLVKELQEDAAIICSAVETAISSSSGDDNVVIYALTTHPGHHASCDCFGGYCYLNNAALCARLLQGHFSGGGKNIAGTTNEEKKCRIAILDIDYHCGNGTASIFYHDPTIFFTSIHCDPNIEYPWNSGYETQIGSGDGRGSTLHIPLPPGSTWDGSYKHALEKAMLAIVQFDPAALVVSLGLDTYMGDAVAVRRGGFQLNGLDYYEMGLCMGTALRLKRGGAGSGTAIPCVFVQEGGYKMDTVGEAASDVLGGFATGISTP